MSSEQKYRYFRDPRIYGSLWRFSEAGVCQQVLIDRPDHWEFISSLTLADFSDDEEITEEQAKVDYPWLFGSLEWVEGSAKAIMSLAEEGDLDISDIVKVIRFHYERGNKQ